MPYYGYTTNEPDPVIRPSVAPTGSDSVFRQMISGEMQTDYEAAVRRAVAQGFEDEGALAQFGGDGTGSGLTGTAFMILGGLAVVALLFGRRG